LASLLCASHRTREGINAVCDGYEDGVVKTLQHLGFSCTLHKSAFF